MYEDMTHTLTSTKVENEIGCCRSSLIGLALVFLLAPALRADDPRPDSTLPAFSAPVLKSEEPSGDGSHFSYGGSGLATIESDEISNGFGFGLIGFCDRFRPLVLRAGMDIVTV